MKKRLTIIAPALIAAASMCFLQSTVAAEKADKSSDSKTGKAGLSSADKKFAENAAKGGMMEVAYGREASQKAQNAEVKQFGNRMVTDHSKANNELKSIASKKGITLPSDEPSAKFKNDRSYMDMMVKDHEKDLSEFQEEAKNGSDADLKRFADKTSKVIAEHLSMARRIDRNVRNKGSSFTPR
jgi:putative membrane protein